MTTTDVEGGPEGRLVPLTGDPAARVVTPRSQPSPEAMLAAHIARLGVEGSGHEQGLMAAYLALSSPLSFAHNAGFLRPGAALAVMVISDEDDDSPHTVDVFVGFLRGIKGARHPQPVSLSAIVGDAPGGCTGPGGTAAAGSRYVEVARATGGSLQSICTADWSRMLEELSAPVLGRRSRFFLSSAPVESSLAVRIDGLLLPASDPRGAVLWSYDEQRRAIDFAALFTPERGAQISVAYDVDCP